jgi:ATP-dependent Lhr-like helicase
MDLDPRIVAAAKKIGIETFTEPQRRAIPRIRGGHHVLLVAPTGIGKTEAALLPILESLLDDKPDPIACLYITPLRALNRDMLRRITFFGEELGLDVAVRHGDTPQRERVRLSRHPPDILITTPETFQIMFTGHRLRDHLRRVRWVVVDEVHELADDERGAQLAVGLERLVDLAGRDVQRIGLSATVGTTEEVARFLGGEGRSVDVVAVPVPKGLRLRVEFPEVTDGDAPMMEALGVPPVQAAAMRRCEEMIRDHRSTLFFVNTRDTAEFLASRLRAWYGDLPVGVHHGSLSKGVRIEAEDAFKAEALKALICTSSLELGIDVGSADFVLQFNSPRAVARLIQRIGRSGHGVEGVPEGVVVATNEDDFAEGCAIARRALAEALEPLRVRENNRSVLANQLAAMVLAAGSVEADEAYATLVRAYPFRRLSRRTFDDVLRQLAELRVLRHRDGRLGRSRGSTTYFYENIGMIPDAKTYRVVDISTRRAVGTLDEWFVAENAKPGATFVMRGLAWRFVEFQEDAILVEPVAEIGEIPSWVGEELPVPYEVAQEVGRLRRTLAFDEYPANEEGVARFRAYVESVGDAPVPTDRVVTIETDRRVLVVNACFGSRVNETLGQLLSSLLSARFGESVGVQTDPYRIVLEAPRRIDPRRVVEILQPQDPSHLEPLLRVVLRNSAYLRWAFVHVAKKFGVLRRDVNWEDVNVGRLLQSFEGSPLYEEVLDKILWERMDVARTAEVLGRMARGDIALVVGRLTPIGRAGLERGRFLVAPPRADRATLLAFRKRLERETTTLLCLHCKASWRTAVGDVEAKVRCPHCEGVMVAALRPYERDLVVLAKAPRPSPEDRARLRRVRTNASLVMAHGRRAVLAMTARGVGPDTAARILRGHYDSDDDFLREVLAAEVQYARTKRFWD